MFSEELMFGLILWKQAFCSTWPACSRFSLSSDF